MYLKIYKYTLGDFAVFLFPISANSARVTFMMSLSFKHGTARAIDRSCVFESVLDLYATKKCELLEEYPFRVRFVGEKAIDVGRVSRDMFSAFYEAAYVKLFDGVSLLTPVVHPHMDMSVLPILGTIISHAYLVSGILPIRIAFPCLAAMILPGAGDLPDEVITEVFVQSLSFHDANVFRDALKAVRANEATFSESMKSALVSVLSRFGCRELPTPTRFMKLIVEVGKYEFLRKPASAIIEIHSGIPDQHLPFWSQQKGGDLYSIYKAQQVSSKVLQLIEDIDTCNPNQERVFGYLKQFIGDIQQDELRCFLRFTTGSSVCSAQAIRVTFNSLEGLARRPIGHTCSNTLELSSCYLSYLDFVSEFKAILSNDEFAWSMDAL